MGTRTLRLRDALVETSQLLRNIRLVIFGLVFLGLVQPSLAKAGDFFAHQLRREQLANTITMAGPASGSELFACAILTDTSLIGYVACDPNLDLSGWLIDVVEIAGNYGALCGVRGSDGAIVCVSIDFAGQPNNPVVFGTSDSYTQLAVDPGGTGSFVCAVPARFAILPQGHVAHFCECSCVSNPTIVHCFPLSGGLQYDVHFEQQLQDDEEIVQIVFQEQGESDVLCALTR